MDQVAAAPGEPPRIVCDLCDPDALDGHVQRLQPEACIHLAGIAFVPMGWSDPRLVFSVNLGGTFNLLEACRKGASRARVLVITSAEVYGRLPSATPLTEEAPLAPSNLYAVSKVAADLSALLYHRRYGMHVMTARPQNHIGPGQSTQFVTGAFAEQLAAMRDRGAEAVIRVGNLECRRDFTDVRDVARAYRLLVERGRPRTAYNIASGAPVRIGDVLRQLCAMAGVKPRIDIDPDRFRPTDDPPVLDTARIFSHAGWRPEIPLHRTLQDIFEDVAARAIHAA